MGRKKVSVAAGVLKPGKAGPNLFDFATGELSQDAFICWLAAWANPPSRLTNEPLYKTATAFLDRLLEVGKGPKVPEYRTVAIARQSNSIDVLLLVNDDIAILIEDKTNTKDPADKLGRYKKVVAAEFPNHQIIAIYLKTGDQCEYGSAEQAGYGCFLRPDFLEILQKGKAWGVTNDTFADFHRYLQGIEEAVRSFSSVLIEKWERQQWKGFFIALRQELGEGEWDLVGHAGGGSLPFRWHQKGETFLRLEGAELAFKIVVGDRLRQEAEWVEWNRRVVAKSGTAGMNLKKVRRKLGVRMTVAVLDGDYRQTNVQGLLDLHRTVETLRRAEALMDAARETP